MANHTDTFGENKKRIRWFIREGLSEDVGLGDHTSLATIPAKDRSEAFLLVKATGVLAGVEIAHAILETVDPDLEWDLKKPDGSKVKSGDTAFEIRANTQAILKAERLLLNTMQRMSGTATLANRFAVKVADLPVKILDTRKTTPLLRFLDKWAVKLGGCENYRHGLYDWFMIKDNHIDACGGIKQAILRVADYQTRFNLALPVTIEVRDLEELAEVLDTGQVTRIMLDNFDTETMRRAVEEVGGRFETEASGGIVLENLRETALTGVDYISSGALTHSARSLDLSLKIRKH